MSESVGRRGFLRGLVSLPLVGGAVKLIGQPVAAAEPITEQLLGDYVAWLAHEHRAALIEQRRVEVLRRLSSAMGDSERGRRVGLEEIRTITECPPMFWFPEAPQAEAIVASAPPSSRAAVVLASVGHQLRKVS